MAEDSKCADLNAEQANAIFEAIGKLYYARYGRLRPGKDDLLRDSMDEENIRQFSQWIKYEALDDAVMCIERLQRERDDFHEDNEVLRLRVERLQHEVDVWKSKAVHRGKSANRLRAGLKQISASMAQAEGLQKIARDALRLADETSSGYMGDVNGPGCDPDTK